MGFTIEKSNFQKLIATTSVEISQSLASSLYEDMIANGFTEIYKNDVNLYSSDIVVFEPDISVDPLHATQPWRIGFKIDGFNDNQLSAWLGTPETMGSSGIDETLSRRVLLVQGGSLPSDTRISSTNRYSFRLVISDHGIVIFIWQNDNLEDFTRSGILCVQRPVNETGIVLTSGAAPVFAICNTDPERDVNLIFRPVLDDKFYAFPVREANYPAPAKPEDLNEDENTYFWADDASDLRERSGRVAHRIPHIWDGPATYDSGEYHIIIPFGLCTNTTCFYEEMDMIAISKAPAFSSGTTFTVDVYGSPRDYTAFGSNSGTQSKPVRVFFLTLGGGV